MKRLIIIFLLLFPLNVFAVNMKEINSTNYLIYDITDNKTIFGKGNEEVRTVASLTKMLTMITAIENSDDLSKKIKIDNKVIASVPWDAYKIGLKLNEEFSLEELLHSLLLRSDATSANAIAIGVSGNISDFTKLMNEEAKKIGLTNSYFSNPIGMDTGGNKSNCDDLEKILEYSLKNEIFKNIFTNGTYILNNGLDVSNSLDNLNNEINEGAKLYGFKTGFTTSAGFCMAFYFNSNGHDYIAITLNAHIEEDNKNPNYKDMIEIINFINENFNNHILVSKDKIIKTLKVIDAKIDTYDIYLNEDVNLYLNNDYNENDIKIDYSGLENLSDKNKKGDKIGKINVYYQDKLLVSNDVYLGVSINHTINQIIRKYKIMYILIILFSLALFKKMFLKNN